MRHFVHTHATRKPLRCLAFSRSPRFGVAFAQNGVALPSFRRRFRPESDAQMRQVAHRRRSSIWRIFENSRACEKIPQIFIGAPRRRAVSSVPSVRVPSAPPVSPFGAFFIARPTPAETAQNLGLCAHMSEPPTPAEGPVSGRFPSLSAHFLRSNRITAILVRMLKAR